MKLYDNPSLPHAGKIESCLLNDDKSKVAIISSLGHGFAPPAYLRPKNRLAIYDQPNVVPLAIFDCHYQIQDISFHPTEPVIAVATGGFNGSFTGELILWNWETGLKSIVTPWYFLYRVQFIHNGQRVLAKQRYVDVDSEDYEWDGDDTLESLYDLEFEYFSDIENINLSFDEVSKQISLQEPEKTKTKLMASRFPSQLSPLENLKSLFTLNEIKTRNTIWDVTILKNDELAINHNKTQFDILSVNDGLIQSFKGHAWGAQVLNNGKIIIKSSNSLYEYDGKQMKLAAEFDGEYVFSIAVNGRVLAREKSQGASDLPSNLSKDIVGDIGSKTWNVLDFGHFYIHLNLMNIKNSPHLFVIQTPHVTPSGRKTLSIVQQDNSLKPLDMRFIEDDNLNSYLSACQFSYIHDTTKEGVIISGSTNTWQMDSWSMIYLKAFPNVVFRKNLDDGLEVWRHRLPSSVSTIHSISSKKVVLVALDNKDFLVIHSETGAIIQWQKAKFNGIETMITAMDSDDNIIAFGTNVGIVASTSIEDIINHGFIK